MKLDNKTYDLLKWLVLIFMPAFITFVGVIGQTLQADWLGPSLTILTAFNTFLGTMIGVSSISYGNKEDKDGNTK
ncbi:phage holin [Streptococcus danieliae]|uniref:Holin n=1 Tax=Streptococcus danieliae TaxID=747656 RepID=A0A7X3KB54_9STRE|nr:phage holin [Streptococcus danieliae]MCU0083088.1 phage holin [Streptococcus danieliae]MVX58256.1 holin [Streptococcus danieliae]